MFRATMMCLALAGLAACESNGGFTPIPGFGEDDGANPGDLPPPAIDAGDAVANNANTCTANGGACAGDVVLVRYDTANPDTLIIRGLPFDDDILDAEYARAGTYISAGNDFDDFENPPEGLDRYVVVYARNGNVAAGAVKNAEYLDTGYGGSFYQVNTAVTGAPEILATYSGSYAGLRAFNGQSGLVVTEGTVILEIDQNLTTAEPVVRGRIDRVVTGTVGAPQDDDLTLYGLGAIDLRDAPINEGTFSGVAATNADTTLDGEFNPEDVTVGTYQGTFGGANAASAAGVVVIGGDLTSEPPGAPVDLTSIGVQETGAFIADKDP